MHIYILYFFIVSSTRLTKDGLKVITSQSGLLHILENHCTVLHLPVLSHSEVKQVSKYVQCMLLCTNVITLQ